MRRVSASPIKQMFLGALPTDGLLPYPVLDAEQRELLDMFRDTLARYAALHIDSRAIDKAHEISKEVGRELKRLDWERELDRTSDSDEPEAPGLGALDEVRRAAIHVENTGSGAEGRHELSESLGRLEQETSDPQ